MPYVISVETILTAVQVWCELIVDTRVHLWRLGCKTLVENNGGYVLGSLLIVGCGCVLANRIKTVGVRTEGLTIGTKCDMILNFWH